MLLEPSLLQMEHSQPCSREEELDFNLLFQKGSSVTAPSQDGAAGGAEAAGGLRLQCSLRSLGGASQSGAGP